MVYVTRHGRPTVVMLGYEQYEALLAQLEALSDSAARQRLSSLLDQAVRDGEARIKRKGGQTFVIRPEPKDDSPLDVEGIDLDLTADEIVDSIHEGRREQR